MSETRSHRSKAPARPSRVREGARALYRSAILDAAESVFAEQGVTASRMQDIAARAGLAVGTIYNYFEQKEDILVALLNERMDGFLEAFAPSEQDPVGFEERLTARIARLLEYTASHRALFQLATDYGLFGSNQETSKDSLLHGRKLPHVGRFESALRAIVDEAAKKELLTAQPRDLLALHLRHSVRTASQWLKANPQADATEVARTGVSLFLNGAVKRASRRK